MPQPTGPIIRSYRKAYHQTAAHLYEGILPRQNFSNYEKGTYDTSVDSFLKLCLRLGASMSDIEKRYIQSDERDEFTNEELLARFYHAFHEEDLKSLKDLIPQLDQAFEETRFLKYRRYRLLCEILSEASPASEEKCRQLLEELLHKQVWFILDSWTMYYLFPMLTLRERIQLLAHFCQFSNAYNQLRIRNAVIRHDTPDLCLGMIEDALTANDQEAFNDSLGLLREIAPREHETFPFFALQLMEGLLGSTDEKPEHGKLDEIIRLYHLIGEKMLADRMMTFWNLLLSRRAMLEVVK